MPATFIASAIHRAQAQGRCGVIPAQTLDEGVAATRAALSRLQQEGYRYAVLD
ncbi:hypothetical protein HZG03_07695, partial [Salmonella enterica subsp. enterica serovar Typhi]|nr:hypothetical protein [Salmonella enterica subsp. enterica serovar Typhi]